MPISFGSMKAYSTAEVAQLAGIHKRTLYRWLGIGAVPEPERGRVAGKEYRIWTPADLKRVKEYKRKFYAKGRGRKKKKA